MSNEELAERIRAGNTELCGELWDGVRRFVHQQAFRYYMKSPGQGGTELDDLIQSGYIAMMKAVERYDSACGSFLNYLDYYLRNEFKACFWNSDPLNKTPVSLDAPTDKDNGKETIADTIPGPDCFEAVEQNMWRQQLGRTISEALDRLPDHQREIVIARYFKAQSLQEIAAERGTKKEAIKKALYKALDSLRRDRNGLEEYIDQRTNFYIQTERAVLIREELRERLKEGEEKCTTE